MPASSCAVPPRKGGIDDKLDAPSPFSASAWQKTKDWKRPPSPAQSPCHPHQPYLSLPPPPQAQSPPHHSLLEHATAPISVSTTCSHHSYGLHLFEQCQTLEGQQCCLPVFRPAPGGTACIVMTGMRVQQAPCVLPQKEVVA